MGMVKQPATAIPALAGLTFRYNFGASGCFVNKTELVVASLPRFKDSTVLGNTAQLQGSLDPSTDMASRHQTFLFLVPVVFMACFFGLRCVGTATRSPPNPNKARNKHQPVSSSCDQSIKDVSKTRHFVPSVTAFPPERDTVHPHGKSWQPFEIFMILPVLHHQPQLGTDFASLRWRN
jgi:hypothetical protein